MLYADGYQRYHKLPGNIRVVGCWAHARRKFEAALSTLPKEKQKDSPATMGVGGLLTAFQVVEQAFAELMPEERYEKQLEQEKTVLDALLAWENEIQVRTAPKSALDKAIHYLLEQWLYLIRYLENGRLELSNNCAECSIKPLPQKSPNLNLYRLFYHIFLRCKAYLPTRAKSLSTLAAGVCSTPAAVPPVRRRTPRRYCR